MVLDLTKLDQRLAKLQQLRLLAADSEASDWILEMTGAAPVSTAVTLNGAEPHASRTDAPSVWWRQTG